MRIPTLEDLNWWLPGSQSPLKPPVARQTTQPATPFQPATLFQLPAPFQPNPGAELAALRALLHTPTAPALPPAPAAPQFSFPPTNPLAPTNPFSILLNAVPAPQQQLPFTVSGGGKVGAIAKAVKTVVQKAGPVVTQKVIPGVNAVSAAKDIYDFAQWLHGQSQNRNAFTPTVTDRGDGRPYNPSYPPQPNTPF